MTSSLKPPTKIRSLKNCLDSPFATILAMSFRSATGDGLNYVAPLKSLDGHGAGSVGNGWATCPWVRKVISRRSDFTRCMQVDKKEVAS